MLVENIKIDKTNLKNAASELQKAHNISIKNHVLNLDSLMNFINEKSTQLNDKTIERLNEDCMEITQQIKKAEKTPYTFFENKVHSAILEINTKIESAIDSLYNAKLSRSLNTISSEDKNKLRLLKNNIFDIELNIPHDKKQMTFKFQFSYFKDSENIYKLEHKTIDYSYGNNFNIYNFYSSKNTMEIVFNSIINDKRFNIILENLMLISDLKKKNHYDALTFIKEFLSGNSIQAENVKDIIPEIKDNAMLLNDITIKDPKKKTNNPKI